MTAIVMRQFGSPDVLHAESIPRPVAGPGQLLVRVRAVAVNPLDAKMRGRAVRELYPAWFPDMLGHDIAGVVEDVGESVPKTELERKSSAHRLRGSFGRRGVCCRRRAAFYKKPPALNFATAWNAALTLAVRLITPCDSVRTGAPMQLSGAAKSYCLKEPTIVDQRDIAAAEFDQDAYDKSTIRLTLNGDTARRFREMTAGKRRDMWC